MSDKSNKAALAIDQTSLRVVTTDLVVVETLNYLCEEGPHLRRAISRWAKDLPLVFGIRLVRFTPDLYARSVQLYGERLDKEWSLVDCSSMVLMHDLKITDILTADHHFEQAGFNILLK